MSARRLRVHCGLALRRMDRALWRLVRPLEAPERRRFRYRTDLTGLLAFPFWFLAAMGMKAVLLAWPRAWRGAPWRARTWR